MSDEIPRSRQARLAAEQALVRVVHHYGDKPEFVVLGGLVPELLCSSSAHRHAGTTDIDVQVNLEIECDAVNTARLERALRNAEFQPDNQHIWRWRVVNDEVRSVAQMLFGMTATMAEHVAGLTLREAKAVVGRCRREMSIRWDNDVELWRDWLIAARSADKAALKEFQLHAKLLFCGQQISP